MIARMSAILANHYLCCIALAALTLLVFFLLLLAALLVAAIELARWVADTAPAWFIPSVRAVLLAIILLLLARMWQARKIDGARRHSVWLDEPREGGA